MDFTELKRQRNKRDRVTRLSRAQKEAILRDLSKGMTYQEIARKRKTGRSTIAKLKRNILTR